MNALELRKKSQDVTATPAGQGHYEFVISSGTVDRDTDTTNPHGWRLEGYRKNPVVLWGHQHTLPPIGRCVDIGVKGDKLVATMEFPPANVYPLADHVRGLVDAGFVTTTSVGFRPIRATPNRERGGMDFHEQELLEWSLVAVPSNPDAVLTPTTRDADMVALTKWLGGGDTPIPIILVDAPDPPPDARARHQARIEREGARISAMHSPRSATKTRIGCPLGTSCPMGVAAGGGDALCPAGAACAFPGAPVAGEHTTNPGTPPQITPRPTPAPAPEPRPSLATDLVARPAGQTDCPKMGQCGYSAGNPCAQNDQCPLGLGPTHGKSDTRVFEAVLTSTTLNAHGDRYLDWIFPAAGAPIFVDHGETTRPVGRAYPGRRDSQRQYGRLVFPPKGYSAASDRAVADIECGLLVCLSTAVTPDKRVRPARKNTHGGWDYPRVQITEVSLVARGANPDTIVYTESPDALLARATPEQLAEACVQIVKSLRGELRTEVISATRDAYMKLSGRLD